MEFCSICTTSFDSDERQIRCSGQRCNRTFHTRCARLTEDLVRTWLDDDSGLFWFCSTCRTEFAAAATFSREDRKRKLDEEEPEPTAVKQSRMDPSLRLPPEVWTMIFQHLDSRWLARVRVVCRDWNELVRSRSDLMDRFLLKLGIYQFVEDLDEMRHFLALGNGFTRAEISFFEMGKDKPRLEWFNPLGESLTTLTCFKVPFGYLYQLLRMLPNLNHLTLDYCFKYGKSAKLNYQLTKLKELSIDHFFNQTHGESIFPILQHICPQITVLKLSIGEYDKFYRDIVRFVFAVRKTLQDIDTTYACMNTKVMDELFRIEGLKLKRINLDCSEQDLIRLLPRQPTVERLHFHGQVTNVSTLDGIATILPNLKQIKLDNIKLGQSSSSKLQNFSRAESIEVHHYGSSDGISGLAHCQSSSLQRLEIYGAYLPSDALIGLPQIATRIKRVSFASCTVERSSDILSFIQQSKSLTTLELLQLRVRTVCETADTPSGHSGVRHLKLVDASKELLHAICELCPNIETLDIKHDLAEDDVFKMGQRLQQLKSLTLHGCRLHGQEMQVECLRPIPSTFNELKKIQIKTWGVPQEKVLEALQGLRKDVEVSYSFW